MFARISAFVIWSLVALVAVFWLLRLTTSAPQAPAYAVAVGKSAVVRADLNRLFGAPPVAVAAVEQTPEAPSRFKLVGVMAPRAREAQSLAGRGVALIAVDGKPAKAFAVGAPLDSGLVLQAVSLRTASIGPAQGARSMLLELPPLAAPTTGVLPQAGFPGSAGASPSPPGFAGAPMPMSNGIVDPTMASGNGAPGSAGRNVGPSGATGMPVPQAPGAQPRFATPGVPVMPGAGADGGSPAPLPGAGISPSGRRPVTDPTSSQ